MSQRAVVIGLLAFASVLYPCISLGEDQAPANNGPFAGTPWEWDVGFLIKPYTKALTRHYNLDEKQEQYTELLLTQRLKRFLGQHDREVRSLFSEYLAYQSSGQLPPREAAKEFARRARPMLAAAHKEIMDGNLSWRKILNDEQRRIHDRDLEGIDKAFNEYDERFTRWSRGQVDPKDFPLDAEGKPRRPMNFEDTWAYYVRRFIEDYRLDQNQQETAYSLLRQMRQDAASYREAGDKEFSVLKNQYQELARIDAKTEPEAYKRAKKEVSKLDARYEKLSRPIKAIFNRLKQKLEAIPRADQRQAFNQRRTRLQKVAARAQAAYQARITGSQPAPVATRPESETKSKDSSTTALAEP